jgi:hypothetical protein
MTLYVLDAVLWMSGIRGHIPQDGDFGAGRGGPSSAANSSRRLMRILAAIVVSVAFLSLAMWAAVWLAIRLP